MKARLLVRQTIAAEKTANLQLSGEFLQLNRRYEGAPDASYLPEPSLAAEVAWEKAHDTERAAAALELLKKGWKAGN